MQGLGGAKSLLSKELVEVVPGERTVLHQLDEQHGFLMTMTFVEEGKGRR